MVRKLALGVSTLVALGLPTGCQLLNPTVSRQDTVTLSSDSTESASLQTELQSDTDFSSLTSASPLINDGGAVFLDGQQTQSLASRGVMSLWRALNVLPPARVRRFGVHADPGARKIEIACSDPGLLDPAYPGGYLAFCFDHTDSSAAVFFGKHLEGTFGIDLPPYDPAFDSATDSVPATGSFGLKPMNLLFDVHARYVKTRSGWKLDAISPLKQVLAESSASHSIHIDWMDIVYGGRTLLHINNPEALLPRTAFVALPRGQEVLIQAEVTGEPAVVTLSAPGLKPIRLFGRKGEDLPSDQVYRAWYMTPLHPHPIRQLALQAIAQHTLESETGDDFDGSAWIVPVQVN